MRGVVSSDVLAASISAEGGTTRAEPRIFGERIWVVGLLLLALAARLYATIGLEGGALVVGECDEPFVQEIAPIVESGNPLRFPVFPYPPVPAYINAALAGTWRALGGGGSLAVQCRVVTLMFSVATVGLVYLLGGFWGSLHGLIAMALYAVTMIAVVVQGNVQVYSTFFVLLAFYCVLRADAERRIVLLALAGLALGLGIASKYSPLFFAAMLVAPSLLSRFTAGARDAPAAADARAGGAAAHVWAGALGAMTAATLAALWVGVMEKDSVYGLLRHLYDQRPHANPFDFHLPWITRLYRVGLAGVGVAGGLAGLALVIPWLRGMSPWAWVRQFAARNRSWLVPGASLTLTVAVFLGIPAMLNLTDFLRYSVFTANAMATGDHGMFPENRPAVSYIGGYIPESAGLPLFFAGLIGVAYVVFRRDRRAAIVLAGAVPAYLLLELTRVKINRYALELFPLWCLFAGVWLGDLWLRRSRAWRVLAPVVTVGIVAFSLLYALAWADFFSPRGNVQTEAGRWLNRAVPRGTSVGVRSPVLVTGSPELLPDARWLDGYHLSDYRDDPEYVLLPNGVYAVMVHYLESFREGYVYRANDWFPSTPSAEDLQALSRVVRGDGYVLVREFRKRPEIFGVEFASHSLRGRTWLVEHTPACGLRVYRRAATGD